MVACWRSEAAYQPRDGRTLPDYTQKEPTLHFQMPVCRRALHAATALPGQHVCVQVPSTIDHVKARIQDNESIPFDQQCSIFAGNQLEDGTMLAGFIAHRKSSLDLALRGHGGMQISITTLTGIPPDQQRPTSSGRQPEEGTTLTSFIAREESTLDLAHRAYGGMQISIKTFTGIPPDQLRPAFAG